MVATSKSVGFTGSKIGGKLCKLQIQICKKRSHTSKMNPGIIYFDREK